MEDMDAEIFAKQHGTRRTPPVLHRSSAASIPSHTSKKHSVSIQLHTGSPSVWSQLRVTRSAASTSWEVSSWGVSAWVLHRNTDIYNHDVEVFHPKRWLDSNIEKV